MNEKTFRLFRFSSLWISAGQSWLDDTQLPALICLDPRGVGCSVVILFLLIQMDAMVPGVPVKAPYPAIRQFYTISLCVCDPSLPACVTDLIPFSMSISLL